MTARRVPLYEAFRQIKRAFDPLGILNPGKIVDAPPMTQNLRYGPGYRTPPMNTFFDYSEFGGMAGAVEMCSGLGACRKKLEGTMCPSYMATLEEEHSTRGRANSDAPECVACLRLIHEILRAPRFTLRWACATRVADRQLLCGMRRQRTPECSSLQSQRRRSTKLTGSSAAGK